jgi:NADPH:quinone reductase-like Zn-dependent oxidoreductase
MRCRLRWTIRSGAHSAPAASTKSARFFEEIRKDIWSTVESRKLQLPIDEVYRFDEIGNAFEHMEANRHLGKIVVTL